MMLGAPVTALFFFNWLRSSRTIIVTSEQVIVGNNKYDIDDIHGLYVEIVGQTAEQIADGNRFRYAASRNAPAAAGSAIGSLVAAAASAERLAIKIDYGEQSRYLIKGLPERRADRLGERIAALIRPNVLPVD